MTPEGCSTTTDVFEVNIDECTGIDDPMADNISIIPNPTNGLFDIVGVKYKEVKVYDYSGNLILQNSDRNTALNISGKPSGIYFVQIICEEHVFVKRIVLE
jgi:hypothetical protein